MNWFRKIPGRAYLLIGVTIFGTANAVTRKLTEIGAENTIGGRNPISFCNVLFVGNLCALAAFLVIYNQQIKLRVIRQLSVKNWINLVIVAIFSGALAPALIFMALEITDVNNVILISRIEPPISLMLAVIFLQAKVNKWVVGGAFISFLGVVITIFTSTPEITTQMLGIGKGDLMTAVGAIAAAIGGILSKVSLQKVPLGLFNIARTAIGTLVFFVTAIYLFGPEHFIDIFSPLLWRWMLFYSLIIVVLGQLSWFAGVRSTTASEISLANSFNPIAGIIAAYLILGNVPTTSQYLGGLVILIGIILNQIGIRHQTLQSTDNLPPTPVSLEAENGFRGI